MSLGFQSFLAALINLKFKIFVKEAAFTLKTGKLETWEPFITKH